jgi:hypothetical protein
LLFRFYGAFFWARFAHPKKPGFPLQVRGSADALPVGFPLQSLAHRQLRNQFRELVLSCHSKLRPHGYTQAIAEQQLSAHGIVDGNSVGLF